MVTESQKKANLKYQQTEKYKQYRREYYQRNKKKILSNYRKKKSNI